jgi:putative transposase
LEIIELHKNYKFRLYPNHDQKSLLDFHFFSKNQAWNFVLAFKIKELSEMKNLPSEDRNYIKFKDLYQLTINHLKERNITFNSGVIQDELRKLDATFQKFYTKKLNGYGFPKFKSSRLTEQSIIIRNQATHWDDKHLKLFRNSIKAKFHRNIPDGAKFNGGIIKRESDGKYYVILNLTIEQELPINSNTSECGIDMNIKNIAITDSEGNQELIPLEDFSKSKYSKNFKKLQKKLSKRHRKKNFSKRTKKLQNKSNKIQKKIKNKKEDCFHKISKEITNNYSRITIENLTIKDMKESAMTFLNRIISDISWGSLITKIKYKSEQMNVIIREINPAFSSQRCSRCGYIHKNNRKSQSDFHCDKCQYQIHADLNASKNILEYDIWTLEQKAILSLMRERSSQVFSI